jgi:integrase
VQDFLDRWLKVNLPGSVAEATEDSYADTVRLHLIPALGCKQLVKLTVADLDKLWKAKRDAGYSSNSVRIMRTVLRRPLGQGECEGIVTRNVARLSTPQRSRARPGRALTVDQAMQLLDAAAGYRFDAAVVLALTYGLRRGEVLGLHWSALDWKAGTLAVTHSMRRIKDRSMESVRPVRWSPYSHPWSGHGPPVVQH